MNRDAFGIPVELRNEMERARVRPIALAARERNKADCVCPRCIEAEKLDAVQRVTRRSPAEAND